MNQTLSFYDATGRIIFTIAGTEESLKATRERSAQPFVVGDFSGQAVYVLNGQVVPRPQNPARLTGSVLSQLPAPCDIYINGVAYKCFDTTAELGFSQPGEYQVRVEAWPYLDKEFTIENPA